MRVYAAMQLVDAHNKVRRAREEIPLLEREMRQYRQYCQAHLDSVAADIDAMALMIAQAADQSSMLRVPQVSTRTATLHLCCLVCALLRQSSAEHTCVLRRMTSPLKAMYVSQAVSHSAVHMVWSHVSLPCADAPSPAYAMQSQP